MVERGELRDVGRALLAEADRLDALEARGELPAFLDPPTPAPAPADSGDGRESDHTPAEDDDDELGPIAPSRAPSPNDRNIVRSPAPKDPALFVTGEGAASLAGRLTVEGFAAGGPYTKGGPVIVSRLDSQAALALAARLIGEGFQVETKGC
jgi:hypothetical protein